MRWLLTIILLIQVSTVRAAEDSSIVVWDGEQAFVDIKQRQLESLVEAPTYQRYENESARAPLQWFRLRIDNRGDPTRTLFLRATDPATHMLVLIEQPLAYSQELPKESVSRRDRVPMSTYRHTTVNLRMDPGLHTFYLGTSSYLGMRNFQIVRPDFARVEDAHFTLFSGFMLGGILFMMTSSLLLFAVVGHRILLSYALYTFTLLPLILNLSGLLGLIGSAVVTDWLERHLAFTGQLAILGLVEFTLALLDLRQLKPRVHAFLRMQTALALMVALVALFYPTDRPLLGVTQGSCAIAILSVLSIGIRLSWQDMRPARFYIAGLGAFLFGATMILISSFEVSLGSADPILYFMAGAVLQSILLPFGIRDRLAAVASEKDQQDHQLREARSLIYILTHDLSGPLFVIQSMAELQEGKAALEPKVRQGFEKIRLAAQSAQAMLKVVKELEAIEAGKMELVLKPVPLLATLQGTLEILKPKAEAKQVQLELKTEVPEDELKKLQVLGERTVLENTIFYNLIVNAIKFSKPDDRIQVLVEVLPQGQVAIRVRDSGIGIPKTLIVNLFSHNAKTSRRGTAGEKGTGLGLPLARRYVQKFGGSIEVLSQAQEEFPTDHWTQFTITLKKAG